MSLRKRASAAAAVIAALAVAAPIGAAQAADPPGIPSLSIPNLLRGGTLASFVNASIPAPAQP